MNHRRALITGINGQDGGYLAEFLLTKGYKICGTLRSSLSEDSQEAIRLQEEHPESLTLAQADLQSAESVHKAIEEFQPDEIYHLAAISNISQSNADPVTAGDVTGIGTTRLLEAARSTVPAARIFIASTAQLFGDPDQSPQTEDTPLRPQNPYSIAKAYAYWTARMYRQSRNMFVSCGILYNHDSPRRSPQFVTRKITQAAARIATGRQESLSLGNLNAARDWGFAGDYVKAMWLMLQHQTPDDFIVATGRTHTVRELCTQAFGFAGIPLTWEGTDENEVGLNAAGKIVVNVDRKYFGPADAREICGDATKAKALLGWSPSCQFEELVAMMTHSDLEILKQSSGDR
jgi:GDPmannose 4,6-dehydratase